MSADRALAEDDQGAREDVRPFDGDRDRRHLVAAPDPVVRPEADALAAVDVHRVVHRLPRALGHVVLGDRREHRGLLAHVDRAGGHDARRVHHVAVRGDAAERFLDAFQPSDRRLELRANARIGAGEAGERLGAADRRARQRDRPARGEAAHQHHPALAGVVASADDPVERHEHVFAAVRPVLEYRVERHVAPADVHARRVGRHERAGDAQVLLVTEEVIGVVEPEGEAEERRHRPERDVALVPGDAHAEHFFALPRAFANHGVVRDGRSVGARLRVSQRETGNLHALGKARQVVILLRIGAVVEQQLRGPERVRYHDADRRRARARGKLHHHRRVRERAEAEAAVLPRDDHTEEAALLDVLPDVRRQVLQLVGDLPVVAHRAELLHGPVEERLLLGREARRAHREELVPVGAPGEKIGVPPHRAGVDRFLLGLRHVGQDAPIDREHMVGE